MTAGTPYARSSISDTSHKSVLDGGWSQSKLKPNSRPVNRKREGILITIRSRILLPPLVCCGLPGNVRYRMGVALCV